MPNRILKESICTSESVDKMSAFEETFFYRLIVNCDDYGRMDARPAILKARLFPLKERVTLRDIEGALGKLTAVGCVEVYEVDDKPYLQFSAWEVHQQIRAKRSKFPAMPTGCTDMKSSDTNGNQMQANVPVIQSESNPNPNPNPSRSRERTRDGGDLAEYFSSNLNHMSPGNYDQLREFLADGIPDDLARFAVDTATAAGKPTWAFTRYLLNQWLTSEVKTVGDAKAYEQRRAESIKTTAKPNPALNYEQRPIAGNGDELFIDLSTYGKGGST